ncbi:MAG TPA: phage holin family protein [Chitinophagaceae bacterium]|nr:phage holin family protein [Chitinophagaceae bacterium]
MKFIVNLLITAAVAYGLSMLLKPHILIDSYTTAIIFCLVLAFLNAILKPLLILLTLPVTILTFGIFLIILNVLIVMLADRMVNGIYIQGFWWALIFGALLSFASSLINNFQNQASR